MRAHEFGEEFGHAATDLWTLDIDTSRLATSATVAVTAFAAHTTGDSSARIFVCYSSTFKHRPPPIICKFVKQLLD